MKLGMVDATSTESIETSIREATEAYVKNNPEYAPYATSFEKGLLLASLDVAVRKIKDLEYGRETTKVVVVWGETPYKDQEPSVYQFDSKQEANAFLIGVDEGQRHGGYATFDTVAQATQYLEVEGA